MAWRARSHTAPPAELRLTAGLAALALLLAGCGSDEGSDAGGERAGGDVVDISGTEPVGEVLAGSVAPLVECRDWNGATDAEKLATVEAVRSAEYPEDPGIEGPALTDEEATELFDNACEPSHAQGFRLYKLYSHAAGFIPLKRALDEE